MARLLAPAPRTALTVNVVLKFIDNEFLFGNSTLEQIATLKATEVSSHARFLFRAERRAGVWWISGFNVIYQRDEITPLTPGQPVAVDPEAVKSFRPSYRLLTYGVESGAVRNDLAGVDRPDLVVALTRETYAWAGLTPPR